METITTATANEILKTLKKIDQKTFQIEANNLKNISKLIDDKFQKNFLKTGSVENQKLTDELDLELKSIQLKNQIDDLVKRKMDIQKLLLDKNIKKLSQVDQDILDKLVKISSDGGLLDKLLKAFNTDNDFSYFSLFSTSFLKMSIYDIQSKLLELAKIPEPIIP